MKGFQVIMGEDGKPRVIPYDGVTLYDGPVLEAAWGDDISERDFAQIQDYVRKRYGVQLPPPWYRRLALWVSARLRRALGDR